MQDIVQLYYVDVGPDTGVCDEVMSAVTRCLLEETSCVLYFLRLSVLHV